jgi:hypothetical protein
VVPKERVRMDKETRVEEEQVSEDVREERIEAEGEPRPLSSLGAGVRAPAPAQPAVRVRRDEPRSDEGRVEG